MSKFNYDIASIEDKFETVFEMTDNFVREYKNALGVDEKKSIPKSIFANYNIWNTVLGKPPTGTIHLKQEMEYFKYPSVNDVYIVSVIINNKYTKKNKDYLVFETNFNKGETLYCKSLTTYLWGFAK